MNKDSTRTQIVARGIPDPTWMLFALVAVAGLLSIFAESPWPAVVIGGLFLLPAMAVLMASSFEIAVLVLCASTALTHYTVSIGNLSLRPEYIAVALLGAALLLRGFSARRWPQWMRADRLLIAYLAANLLSSLLFSPAPSQTTRWAIEQCLAAAPYFLLRFLIRDEGAFERGVRILLAVTTVAAAFGLLCFFSYRAFGTGFGVNVDQYANGVPGTYGTQSEANILGSFAAAGYAVLLGMYLRNADRRLLLPLALNYAAMLIAMSRGALGGAIVATAALLFVFWRRHWFERGSVRRAAIVVLCTTLILSPVIVPMYLSRSQEAGGTAETRQLTESVGLPEDTDVGFRLLTWALAAEDILEHPIFGSGTASFQLRRGSGEIGVAPAEAEGGMWIGNTEVRALYDTGIIGLALFIAFLGSLAWRAWTVLKRHPDPVLAGLFGGLVVYAFAFQFTDGTLLAFPWVHAGFLAGAVALASARNRSSIESPAGP